MSKKVVIIGSGIGGLASAVRLAVAGFKVEVFEKNTFAGGKIAEFRNNGYRFDTGASLMTLPELIQELFTLSGENPEDYIIFDRLDISCKYFYPDGSSIVAYANPNKFADEILNSTSVHPNRVWKYLRKANKLYNLTAEMFIFSPFQKLSTFLTPAARTLARNIYRIDAFASLHYRNNKSLRDPKLIQLFDRYATYNGSNPYKAPATLKIISHLEHNSGVYLPRGGMYNLVRGLLGLAEKLNIPMHFNSSVKELIVEDRRVKGLVCNGQKIESDIVVSNMDVFTHYRELLKNSGFPTRLKNQELSSSAIIFYWGVKKHFPRLDIHNIIFSGNYHEEFRYIFRFKKLYHDPTVYIYISSKLNQDDAPENCENWFIMINTPNNTGQDWKAMRREARKNIIRKIDDVLDISIEDLIETEECQDPELIEHYTNSYRGALYGPSSNSKLSAFYRHANYTNRIKGLYFSGGSVHPGGGIPLCVASAKIASELIIKDYAFQMD